jgi:serine/threonine-protein phosphatase 2B catalytic subunit
VGELKSITGSAKLPYGTLALGTEGIKDAISGFDDAYVSLFFPTVERSSLPRLKSDIENEPLPPELFDAEEAKAFLALHAHSQSLPEAPSPGDLSLSTSGSIEASIAAALSSASLASSQSQSSVGGPSTPTSPTSSPSKVPFRGRHGRQASLGTTRTSPSTRRRSLESTISMIQEALDGKDLEAMANEGTGTGEGGYFGGGELKGSG